MSLPDDGFMKYAFEFCIAAASSKIFETFIAEVKGDSGAIFGTELFLLGIGDVGEERIYLNGD